MTRRALVHRWVGKMLAGVMFLAVFASLPIRADEPTPARAFYNTFTDEEEMALGRKAAEETDKQLPILVEPLLTEYVSRLGQKVAKESRRPQLEYSFKIVNTDEVNAFSLPGGHIYVNRGLLDFVTNESELAGVLAHEIGHVVAFHSMNDVARRALVDQGLQRLQKSGLMNDQQMSDMMQKFGGPMLLFVDRKFSREEESEADLLGMYNVIRAGYDPEGLIDFLQRLTQFTGNPSLLEGLLMNHPLPGERVTALRAELEEHPAPSGLEKDSLAFKAAKLQLKVLPAPPPPKKNPQE
jgi:beta-barrel assembly-enhancing protease